MPKNLLFVAKPEDVNIRIDNFLSEQNDDLSRSAIQKLIENGSITVCNDTVSKSYRLRENDVIQLDIPEPMPLEAIPQNIPLNIVYEDESFLIVNKDKGMVVHPAPGNLTGTMVNALMYHCAGRLSGINGILRPGILHRIDKDTSGLLAVAKNDTAHRFLADQIKDHSFTRQYRAILCGRLPTDEGCVNAPIGRNPGDRKKMAVTDKNSKHAVTHYKVLNRYDGFTDVEVQLETGRTHQIRVHMAYIEHPVAGDIVYGKHYSKLLNGQCLHAKKLGFIHPVSRKYIEFDSELPFYYSDFLSRIGPIMP